MPDHADRYRIVVAVGALLVAVLAGMWWGARPPAAVPVTAEVENGEPRVDTTITVHVSGAVAAPGLVHLPQGARVADAVAAAGGALSGADLGQINLAANLRDGDQVEIPLPGATAALGRSGEGPNSGVDLNRASVEELQQLPGVGPVLAARIVDYRTEHGAFESVEDLLDVPGIGESKLEQLRSSVARP